MPMVPSLRATARGKWVKRGAESGTARARDRKQTEPEIEAGKEAPTETTTKSDSKQLRKACISILSHSTHPL